MDRTIYFAHPISLYCTPVEDNALATLRAQGWTVVNPSDRAHQEACGNDMANWAALAGTCDAVALLPFEDGKIGAGVVKEVETVHGQGKPVFAVAADGMAVTDVSNWPDGFSLLSVEDTRARINPFREARKQAGLHPIPMREPETVGAAKKKGL